MAPVTARSMARRCVRRHTRAWYSPLGCAWCHPGAATEALEAVPPLGIAAPAPKRSTTQPIPASRAPPESPMGTRCPPPPPRLQASRSTSSSARGAASRRTSAGAESSATSAQFESTNGKLAFARARRRHGLDSEPATSAHDPSSPHGLPYESAGRVAAIGASRKATPGRGCRPCGVPVPGCGRGAQSTRAPRRGSRPCSPR